VHGDPAHAIAVQFALARVDSRADLGTEAMHLSGDLGSAADRACGAVEGGEDAVARAIDLAATEALEG
jgi:hypothetical protein